MHKTNKTPKQLTLDNLPKPDPEATHQTSKCIVEKQIIITQIDAATKEEELALKTAFRLQPSKTSFSRVKADLWFDNQPINSVLIRILQGPLATDESEYSAVLDMTGIPAGAHTIKVEMYELWSSGERLCQAVKETVIAYVPQTRQSRLVKIPIVKSVAGADLAVVSQTEKDIYREIEKTVKKEYTSKRDEW